MRMRPGNNHECYVISNHTFEGQAPGDRRRIDRSNAIALGRQHQPMASPSLMEGPREIRMKGSCSIVYTTAPIEPMHTCVRVYITNYLPLAFYPFCRLASSYLARLAKE